jgi:hypothetical protein
MSRQNKVNPGTYTQRGRLTQDDAARELRKQSAIASPHTWQPENTKTRPQLAPARATATKVAPSNAKVKAAKAKTASTRRSKRTTGTAQKTGRRTAVLARNVGGGGAAPRPTRQRRKS